MSLSRMFVPFIIIVNLSMVFSSEFTLFKRIAERDGRSCFDTDIVMDMSEELLAFEDCLSRCAWDSNCTSVFYKADSKMCVGCGINYGTPGSLPDVTGTIAYHKKARYMDKCVDDSDCSLPNMACYDEQCQCDPGYPFDSSTESCVTGCGEYGETFQVFKFAKLTSTPYEQDTNCFVHINFNPKECKDYCASQPWCKSFDHAATYCRCRYHEHTALTKPSKWLTILTPYFHYQKNCA